MSKQQPETTNDKPATVQRLAASLCSAFVPKIGDEIYAIRIRKSTIYHNRVLGQVVDTWDNACRVVTNPGTEIEGDFRLHYNEWHIRSVFTENFPPPNAEVRHGASDADLD